MELANVRRVIVETTPSFQRRATEVLIQMGAVMRRVSRCIKEQHSAAYFDPKGILIEAVVDGAETNSVVQALSRVNGDGCAVTVSVSDAVPSDMDRDWPEEDRCEPPRQEKWGDYIITV
jgi:hypothetical protein